MPKALLDFLGYKFFFWSKLKYYKRGLIILTNYNMNTENTCI